MKTKCFIKLKLNSSKGVRNYERCLYFGWYIYCSGRNNLNKILTNRCKTWNSVLKRKWSIKPSVKFEQRSMKSRNMFVLWLKLPNQQRKLSQLSNSCFIVEYRRGIQLVLNRTLQKTTKRLNSYAFPTFNVDDCCYMQ